MKDFKKQIASCLNKLINMNEEELESFIEKPKDAELGDYALPCFRFSKIMGKSPNAIAEEWSKELNFDGTDIENVSVAGPYLNFQISKQAMTETVLREIEEKKEEFGQSKIGEGKTILVEYSSPNIATISYRTFKNDINRKSII